MNRREELLDAAEQNADWARAQREEYRSAGVARGDCGGDHHMVADGRGGGVCTGCDLYVDGDEL